MMTWPVGHLSEAMSTWTKVLGLCMEVHEGAPYDVLPNFWSSGLRTRVQGLGSCCGAQAPCPKRCIHPHRLCSWALCGSAFFYGFGT